MQGYEEAMPTIEKVSLYPHSWGDNVNFLKSSKIKRMSAIEHLLAGKSIQNEE